MQLLDSAKAISAKRKAPAKVVVAAGDDAAALEAIVEAQKLGIASGVLVGNQARIISELQRLNQPPDVFEIIDEGDEAAIGKHAMRLIREKRGDIVMKGKIKTAALFKAVLDAETGLRTSQLISDIFIFEYPAQSGARLIMITDGGVTLSPDLKQKISLIENAVTVAHALGNKLPRVAVLSATETVNPALPSSVDAAILSKMNQRGQIANCLIDGPLALDNAISEEAARQKGIQSDVAGNADILLCPNIESANMLAKGTTYFAHLPLAHICIGAMAPILIPSRSDSAQAKLMSIALSVVVTDVSF
ncbi:bifunctional enoyl-CoA hydratase/phosphate acetyltransferase [candidate division KSB1 bacterium]|nr:bifunctional enoyl-CoA hydratase/phosphate acetyltransferase [candidate division KSB1 bacterium]